MQNVTWYYKVGKVLTYYPHEMEKKYNRAKMLERCPTGK